MRLCAVIDEFQKEAGNAVFTKTQAMQISLNLLKKELDAVSSAQDAAVIRKAIEYFNFHYLDSTESETDAMLDAFNVARLTTADITKAIRVALFDAE